MLSVSDLWKYGIEEFMIRDVPVNVHEFEDYIWECECPTLGG